MDLVIEKTVFFCGGLEKITTLLRGVGVHHKYFHLYINTYEFMLVIMSLV